MKHYKRSFTTEVLKDKKYITLEQEESHHLLNVRRADLNDKVILINGMGELATCLLAEVKHKQAICRIIDCKQFPLPPPTTLFLACTKKKSLCLTIEKCSELGLSNVVLMTTAYSQKIPSQQTFIKLLQKTAIQALKQSQNLFLPNFFLPTPLENLCKKNVPPFFASLRHGRPLLHLLHNSSLSSFGIAIGPEGGWSLEEEDLFISHGSKPVLLCQSTLRSETSAITSLFLFQHLLMIS